MRRIVSKSWVHRLSRFGALAAVTLAGIVVASASGRADTKTFSGSGFLTNGDPASATAVFTATGTTLTIDLTNTSASVLHRADTLQGVLFSLVSGTPSITVPAPGSAPFSTTFASLPAGNTIYTNNNNPPGVDNTTNLNSFWGFTGSGSLLGQSFQYAVTSTGLVGSSSANNTALDGNNGGIIPTTPPLPDGFNDSAFPLVKNTVHFTLTVPSGFLAANIIPVGFYYGTGTDDASIIIPEPATLVLLGIGVAGIPLLHRIPRQRKRRVS